MSLSKFQTQDNECVLRGEFFKDLNRNEEDVFCFLVTPTPGAGELSWPFVLPTTACACPRAEPPGQHRLRVSIVTHLQLKLKNRMRYKHRGAKRDAKEVRTGRCDTSQLGENA